LTLFELALAGPEAPECKRLIPMRQVGRCPVEANRSSRDDQPHTGVRDGANDRRPFTMTVARFSLNSRCTLMRSAPDGVAIENAEYTVELSSGHLGVQMAPHHDWRQTVISALPPCKDVADLVDVDRQAGFLRPIHKEVAGITIRIGQRGGETILPAPSPQWRPWS
jgi:hypothetical protein